MCDEAMKLNEVEEPVDHLANAFFYNNDSRQEDIEKAIRCVAYLLEFHSDTGNYDIPATAANGLSELLHECAKRTRVLRSIHDE